MKDVKVIPDEECVQQHNLVFGDFSGLIPRPKKRKLTPPIPSWKLRDQAVANEFKGVFTESLTATQPNNPTETVEDNCAGLKKPLLEAATEVCGLSKGHQWKKETWWWDVGVENAVKLKRARFKTYRKLVKARQTGEAKVAKEAYNDAKRLAKKTVWQAKAKAEEDTFANISPNDSSIFKVAKQMDWTNQDVVGEKCVRNGAGELSLSNDDKMKAWVEHYSRLLKVEFEWPSALIPEVPSVECPPRQLQ